MGPIPGSQKGILSITPADSNRPGIAAARREQQKITKYNQCALENNLQFIPFVLESSGRIGEIGMKHLQEVAKYGAEQRQCAYSQLFYYLKKRISCALHKTIANNINKRLFINISGSEDTSSRVHGSFYDPELSTR